MKKLTTLVAVLAVLASNAGYAQNNMRRERDNNNCNQPECRTYDRRPLAEKDRMKNMRGTECCADFQWGFAIAGLAVLGTVVGLTAASAVSNGPNYSH